MLCSLRPGATVDVLCVVLGNDGPRTYKKKDTGEESYFCRLQVADSSCPSGVALLFFGRPAFQVFQVTPFRPVLFSRVLVKVKASDDGMTLYWRSGQSTLNLDPPVSDESIALGAWSEKTFGKLATAAKSGRVTLSRAFRYQNAGSSASAVHICERGIQDVSKLDELGVNRRLQCENVHASADRKSAHAQGDQDENIGASFSAVLGGSECCMIPVKVLAAKLSKPKNKGFWTTLSAHLIRSLVRVEANSEDLQGEASSSRRISVSGRRKVFKPFWLILKDSMGDTRAVIVRNAAATRLFVGVSADAAWSDIALASTAADALSDLVREQDDLHVLVRAVSIAALDRRARAEFDSIRLEECDLALLSRDSDRIIELLDILI